MIKQCDTDTLTGLRDRYIFVFMLDTGVRASELSAINLDDINLISGKVTIRLGKARKQRTVWVDSKTRKWLRSYL